jgi:hypothetical protein
VNLLELFLAGASHDADKPAIIDDGIERHRVTFLVAISSMFRVLDESRTPMPPGAVGETEFRSGLPKVPTGKVMRRLLRESDVAEPEQTLRTAHAGRS